MSGRLSRRWRAALICTPDNLACQPFLSHRGSLTRRLQQHGEFSLRVLRQTLALPTADEAAVLGVLPHRLVQLREVALCCDGRVLVFAHTVLPCLPRGPLQRWLARLGARSLGLLLFSHPGFARGELNYLRIDRRHALFAAAAAALAGDEARQNASFWARRSIFSLGRQRVLVTEVFAPLSPSASAPRA